jgi:dihydrofolate reductase
MRKLILEIQISIDGFIAGADGHTDWMIWNWGPDWKWDDELRAHHTSLTKSIDCVLLSRKMAEEGFIAHWASVAENNNDPQYEFAKHVTDSLKVVFTKTLDKSISIPGGWSRADIAKGDIIDEVNRLKNQTGKNMIAYGGATFVSSLIDADLIDEFHLLVNPAALGNGLPIFRTRKNMVLLEAKAFDCGVTLLRYRRKL